MQVDRTEIVSVQPDNFSQVSIQFAHKVVAPFLILQRRDVVLKLLCPRRGIRGQLPIVRHAWLLVHMRLSENGFQHLLVGQAVFLNLLCHSFWPIPSGES